MQWKLYSLLVYHLLLSVCQSWLSEQSLHRQVQRPLCDWQWHLLWFWLIVRFFKKGSIRQFTHKSFVCTWAFVHFTHILPSRLCLSHKSRSNKEPQPGRKWSFWFLVVDSQWNDSVFLYASQCFQVFPTDVLITQLVSVRVVVGLGGDWLRIAPESCTTQCIILHYRSIWMFVSLCFMSALAMKCEFVVEWALSSLFRLCLENCVLSCAVAAIRPRGTASLVPWTVLWRPCPSASLQFPSVLVCWSTWERHTTSGYAPL